MRLEVGKLNKQLQCLTHKCNRNATFGCKYNFCTSFKTFLLTENIKLVDKKISDKEIVEDFNKHIAINWNEQDIESSILEYNKNPHVFLNEYLYAKSKKIDFNFDDSVNIEQIMHGSGSHADAIRDDAGISTKKEFDFYVNKLGNKILLEENINKSIGREWFKTKKQKSIKDKRGYKDSKYNIAKKLIEYPKDTWTKEDIDIATNKVSERLIQFIFNKEKL